MKYAPKDWQIYYNRGNAYLDMNKSQEALNDYLRALKIRPHAPEILHNRAQAYLHLSETELALDDAEEVLGINPNFARACYTKAQALDKLGKKPEALAAYREFLRMGNPTQDADLLQKALERLKALEGK